MVIRKVGTLHWGFAVEFSIDTEIYRGAGKCASLRGLSGAAAQ